MHDKEFQSVLALPAPGRYECFLKRVAEWEELWGLWSEAGWAAAGEDEGHEMIPVWPHGRSAVACASGGWAGDEARSIALSVWMEKWLPGMQADGLLVALFLTPAAKGIPVPPERIKEEIEEQLQQYEND